MQLTYVPNRVIGALLKALGDKILMSVKLPQVRWVSSTSSKVEQAALRVIDALLRALGDEHEEVRSAAARACDSWVKETYYASHRCAPQCPGGSRGAMYAKPLRVCWVDSNKPHICR